MLLFTVYTSFNYRDDVDTKCRCENYTQFWSCISFFSAIQARRPRGGAGIIKDKVEDWRWRGGGGRSRTLLRCGRDVHDANESATWQLLSVSECALVRRKKEVLLRRLEGPNLGSALLEARCRYTKQTKAAQYHIDQRETLTLFHKTVMLICDIFKIKFCDHCES